MNKLSRRGWFLLLGGLAVIGGGCSKGDTERLARVGRKIVEKADEMTAAANNRLHTGLRTSGVSLSGLDARVSERLRWDKDLENTHIQVDADGPVVTLRGPVPGLVERQRAVAIAQSTVGVQKVVDLLEMPKTE